MATDTPQTQTPMGIHEVPITEDHKTEGVQDCMLECPVSIGVSEYVEGLPGELGMIVETSSTQVAIMIGDEIPYPDFQPSHRHMPEGVDVIVLRISDAIYDFIRNYDDGHNTCPSTEPFTAIIDFDRSIIYMKGVEGDEDTCFLPS